MNLHLGGVREDGDDLVSVRVVTHAAVNPHLLLSLRYARLAVQAMYICGSGQNTP